MLCAFALNTAGLYMICNWSQGLLPIIGIALMVLAYFVFVVGAILVHLMRRRGERIPYLDDYLRR